MRFCLIHVEDWEGGPGEEAMVILPGGEKVAIAVPVDVLPRFLAVLELATAETPPAVCGGCGCELPGRPAEDRIWRDVVDAA